MINHLNYAVVGRWVNYDNGTGVVKKGRIKMYSNVSNVAYVVFDAPDLENDGHAWKSYPSEMIDYQYLTFVE